jgi:choline dehydrogenase
VGNAVTQSETYDYIVVGAGSAGCAVAARLSEDGHYRVLLVEAGGRDKHVLMKLPLGVGKMLTDPRFVWQYWTTKQQDMAGQPIYWPRGRALGGSSSVNGMVYVRGDARRYDGWAAQGNEGWAWNDCLPYFQKLEDCLLPGTDGTLRDTGGRARGGPIACSETTQRDEVSKAYIDACQQWGAPFNADYNGASCDGVGWMQFSIRNGLRCSTAVGYLRPAAKRANLRVMTEASVDQLLFDGKRATGVRVRTAEGLHEFKARREVILSAGPIVTPKLLELSGVGNGELLSRLGIPVVHDLPGVGENLQDHLQTRINYRINRPVTVNDLMNNPLRGAAALLKWLLTRRGLLSTSSANCIAQLHSAPDEPIPDIKVQLTLYSAKDRYANKMDDKNSSNHDPFSGIGFGQIQLYPESRGSVHIQSSNPSEDPAMDPNYLGHPRDVEVTMRAMRIMREIASQPALAPYIVEESLPGAACATDSDMLAYVKASGQTSWHPMGSCRMGNGELDVVDARLRVRGLQGLRVIDSSIMPDFTASNINIPTIMIGEKGAAMVRADAADGP